MKQRDYPIGIPLKPPPNWQGPGGGFESFSSAPSSGRQRGNGPSPFHKQLSFLLKLMLLSLLVFVCMGIGWMWVQRPTKSNKEPEEKVARKNKNKANNSTPASDKRPEEEEDRPAPMPMKKNDDPMRPKPPPGEPRNTGLTWQKDILPIMQRSCISCHKDKPKKGGLDLRTLTALMKGGRGGPGVKARNLNDSPLWETIDSGRMPPGKTKLSAKEKQTIRDWIDNGAK